MFLRSYPCSIPWKESTFTDIFPSGYGHGFISLQDNSLFCYKVTDRYDPKYEGGIRWNDPDINIDDDLYFVYTALEVKEITELKYGVDVYKILVVKE